MKALTVDDLLGWCTNAKQQGFGKRVVLISDDEEGNGFHPIYEGFSLPGDLFLGAYAPSCDGVNPSEAQDKAIILS